MNPGEVAHVFEFVRTGTNVLVQSWAPVLSYYGMAVRVTGVFCHQTPKAHYDNAGQRFSAELADLLVVHEHQWQPAQPGNRPLRTRRAVLVQAKMADEGVCRKPDPVQEFLYQHWPAFKLVGRGPNGQAFEAGLRDLRPNEAGARYGLIATEQHLHGAPANIRRMPFCCGFPWWFTDPQGKIRTAGNEDAGAFIANMLYRSLVARGREAGIPPALSLQAAPNNHFDVTVEELLTVTAKKTLRYKNKRISGPRGQSGVACYQASHGAASLLPPTGSGFAVTSGDGDGWFDDEPPDDDFDDGISLLLIETGTEARMEEG